MPRRGPADRYSGGLVDGTCGGDTDVVARVSDGQSGPLSDERMSAPVQAAAPEAYMTRVPAHPFRCS